MCKGSRNPGTCSCVPAAAAPRGSSTDSKRCSGARGAAPTLSTATAELEACIVSRDMHQGQHGHASCLAPRKMVGHAQVSASESKTPAARADEGTCSGRSAIKLQAFYPKHLVFINPYLISRKGLTIYTPKVRHKLQRTAGTKLSIKCD